MSWIDQFAGLSALEKPVKDVLIERARIVTMPADHVIFGPGMPPDNLILLLDGTIRVQQVSEGGREIVLYRVRAGESCVLTTACLLAFEDYTAEGITETEVRAATIPREVFDQLIADSRSFRNFVFQAYSRRITNLFMVIEEIAFQRMDIRLAQKLIELAGEEDVIKSTHQKLAIELGTAREVVSRQMQEFQRRGWVEQSRGTVEILNRSGLQKLADTSD